MTVIMAFGVRVGDQVRLFGLDSNLSGTVVGMDWGGFGRNPKPSEVTVNVQLKKEFWFVVAKVPLTCLTVLSRPEENPKKAKAWTADVSPIDKHAKPAAHRTTQATQDARDQCASSVAKLLPDPKKHQIAQTGFPCALHGPRMMEIAESQSLARIALRSLMLQELGIPFLPMPTFTKTGA